MYFKIKFAPIISPHFIVEMNKTVDDLTILFFPIYHLIENVLPNCEKELK